MGLKANAFATVWETRERNGRIEARMSTSYRNRETNAYITDWSEWMTLYGEAKRLTELPARSRIKIGDFDVTNKYDKDKQKMYTNYRLFSFETVTSKTAPQTAAPAGGVHNDVADDPF